MIPGTWSADSNFVFQPREFNSANTSAAWPLAETLSQNLPIFPSPLISAVLRTIPLYDRPMNFLVLHTP